MVVVAVAGELPRYGRLVSHAHGMLPPTRVRRVSNQGRGVEKDNGNQAGEAEPDLVRVRIQGGLHSNPKRIAVLTDVVRHTSGITVQCSNLTYTSLCLQITNMIRGPLPDPYCKLSSPFPSLPHSDSRPTALPPSLTCVYSSLYSNCMSTQPNLFPVN